MRLRKLYLSGFKGLKYGLMNVNELKINFDEIPEGLCAIVGENGCGKTTIMDNCQPYVTLPSRVGKLSEHVIGEGVRDLEFTVGAKTYRSIIRVSEKGKHDVELSCDGESLTKSYREYEERLEKLLGPLEVFLAGVFCAQKRVLFGQMERGTRKELFFHLYDLRKYLKWFEDLGNLQGLLTTYISLLDGAIASTRDRLSNKIAQLPTYNVHPAKSATSRVFLDTADALHKRQSVVNNLEKNSTLLEELQRSLSETIAEKISIDTRVNYYRETLLSLSNEENVLLSQILSVGELELWTEDALRGVRVSLDELSRLQTLQAQLRDRLANAAIAESVPCVRTTYADACPLLEKFLVEGSKASLEETWKETTEKIDALLKERDRWNTYLTTVSLLKSTQDKQARLTQVRERISSGQKFFEEAQSKQCELILKLTTLNERVESLREDFTVLSSARMELSETSQIFTRLRKELDLFFDGTLEIERLNQEVRDFNKALILAHARLLDVLSLKDACGKNGIPALELDAAGEEFASIANTLLEEFGYRLWLTTLKRNRDGSLAEDFSVQVSHGDGVVTPLQWLSGGEAVWVEAAIAVAVQIVHCRRAVAPFATAFIDEFDGSLSHENRVKYYRLLRLAHDLTNRRHTFVITQDRTLASMLGNALICEPGGVRISTLPVR